MNLLCHGDWHGMVEMKLFWLGHSCLMDPLWLWLYRRKYSVYFVSDHLVCLLRKVNNLCWCCVQVA